MDRFDRTKPVEIAQQNTRGPGRALAAITLALFLLTISGVFIHRSIRGEGAFEEIVVTFVLFLPVALVLTIAALFELAVVLPRRLSIGADGIRVRFSTWPLPRPKFLPRRANQQATAVRRRHHNYAIYPSGRVGQAPIVSEQVMIHYGTGWFGPGDADQAESLVDAINTTLARTAPGKGRAEE